MLEFLRSLADDIGTQLHPASLAILGVGLGAMLLVFGLTGMFAGRDPVLRRISEHGRSQRRQAVERGLLQHDSKQPTGLMRSLIPADRAERTDVQRQLAQAGFNGPGALMNYYLLRITLAAMLPACLLALVAGSRTGLLALPVPFADTLNSLGQVRMTQLLAVLVGIGFFGPVYWVRGRSSRRRNAITDAFPNALDLMQISVEAGLGLDAAMIRVGNELERASPEISQEFLRAQREIQAGRNRDSALIDMAQRTRVEEVQSFVSVVLQSIQYGSSIGEVLTTYAKDMRLHRELKAQEKANRLPVQMSAVMATLMLPALLLLSIGPVAIRYIRYFGG